MPTRFKYTKSAPIDFGLTPTEILLATDAELNALAGVKHIAPYRRGGMGKTGMGLGKRIRELKSQLSSRTWDDLPSQLSNQKKNKRKDKAGGSGANADGILGKRKWGAGEEPQGQGEGQSGEKKKRLGKKQRQKLKAAEQAPAGDKADGLKAVPIVVNGDAGREGEDKKKARRKKRKSGAGEQA